MIVGGMRWEKRDDTETQKRKSAQKARQREGSKAEACKAEKAGQVTQKEEGKSKMLRTKRERRMWKVWRSQKRGGKDGNRKG